MVVGFATGHVFCYRYDTEKLNAHRENLRPTKEESKWLTIDGAESKDGVELLWKTKRHHGSVRSLCISGDGDYIFTVGKDNVVKKAKTIDGRVAIKVELVGPQGSDVLPSFNKMVLSRTHPLLLLGDDEGSIWILNTDTLQVKDRISRVHHGDTVSAIAHYAGRSVHRYVSLSSLQLAHWDSRVSGDQYQRQHPPKGGEDDPNARRRVFLSEEQNEDMQCMTFLDPSGEIDKRDNLLICGTDDGVLTIWNPMKNDLNDQINRVPVCKGNSIESVCSTLQDDHCVWCGSTDGNIYRVDAKRGRILEKYEHNCAEEVMFLDLDCNYRVFSGTMESVKLWGDEYEPEPPIGSLSSEEELSNDSSESEIEEPNSKKRKQAQRKNKKNEQGPYHRGVMKIDL